MSLYAIARFIILAGVILILIGVGMYLVAKWGLPLGRLPGDIVIRRGNFTVAIPIATSILLSLLLTIFLNIIIRLLNR